MSSVFIFSPLTAESAHWPDPIQFETKAAPVPSPPWPVWFCSLLIGQSPLQQAQPGGLSLRLCVGPFGVLGRFGPRGEGGLLLWLGVQQVLQVVQGQKVIVAFQKLFHELQEGEKKRWNLIVRECARENNSISDTFHSLLLLFFPSLPPLLLDYSFISHIHSQSTLFFLFPSCPLPPPQVPARHQEKGAEREPPWSPGASGGAERHKAAQDTAWQQWCRAGKKLEQEDWKYTNCKHPNIHQITHAENTTIHTDWI